MSVCPLIICHDFAGMMADDTKRWVMRCSAARCCHYHHAGVMLLCRARRVRVFARYRRYPMLSRVTIARCAAIELMPSTSLPKEATRGERQREQEYARRSYALQRQSVNVAADMMSYARCYTRHAARVLSGVMMRRRGSSDTVCARRKDVAASAFTFTRVLAVCRSSAHCLPSRYSSLHYV